MINCVIPTHRPGFIAAAVAAVRAQTEATRVIVVENGAAIGACASHGLDVDVVLTSPPSAPAARNTGLRYVQRLGGGLISFFDDDDLYYPLHLSVLMEAWPGHGVAGRSAHYLRTRDGRLLFLAHDSTRYVLVQSMLCRAQDVGPWDDSLPVEEVDVAWCKGKELHVAAPEHFAFNNHPGPHLWAPDDVEWPVRCPDVFDLGPYDAAIVNGTRPPPQRERLSPTFDAANAMFGRLEQRKREGTY